MEPETPSRRWHDIVPDPFFDNVEPMTDSSPDAMVAERNKRLKNLPALATNDIVPLDAANSKVFSILWDRLWYSEKYVRYRISEGKRNRRQQKEFETWPDDRELAFWIAVIIEVPRARRKEMYNGVGKPLGRNESVSKVINQLLNIDCNDETEKTTRKQVSSHIQSLKPFFLNEPFVLDYLQGDHTSRQSHLSCNSSKTSRSRHPFHHPNRRLQYVSGTEPMPSPESFVTTPLTLLPGGPMLPSQGDTRDSTLVGYLDFRMYSRDSTCKLSDIPSHRCGPASVCQYEYLHMFTVSKEGRGMPDIRVHDLVTFTENIPELREANVMRVKGCPIVYAESSLAIPAHEMRTDADVQLLIEGTIATTHRLDTEKRWICRTTFYDGHIRRKEVEQEINSINDYSAEGLFRHSLPFASKFWADKLVELTSMQRSAATLEQESLASQSCDAIDELKSPGSSKQARDLQDHISNRLKSITARQEIIACSNQSTEDEEQITHLIIFWHFRQTGPNEEGITQFRHIVSAQVSEAKTLSQYDSIDINLQYTSDSSFEFVPCEQGGSAAHGQPQSLPRELDLLASAATFDPSFYDDVFAAIPAPVSDNENQPSLILRSNDGLNQSQPSQSMRHATGEDMRHYGTGSNDQTTGTSTIDEDRIIEPPIIESYLESQRSLLTFIRELKHIEQQQASQQGFAMCQQDFTPTESTSSHPTPSYAIDDLAPDQFTSQNQSSYELPYQHSHDDDYTNYEMSFDETNDFAAFEAHQPKQHFPPRGQDGHQSHHGLAPHPQQLLGAPDQHRHSGVFDQQTEAGQDPRQGAVIIPLFDPYLFGTSDQAATAERSHTDSITRLLPSALED